jgi:hypothetical protein
MPELSISLPAKIVARFWSRVDANRSEIVSPHVDSPCWVWTAGKTTSGYGTLAVGESHILTHRASWLLNHGPIPDGLFVLHRCDNRACVRPDHLFLGTHLDNARDKEAKGRGGQLRGAANPSSKRPERLPRGEAHARSKLTTDSVLAIRARRASGEAIAVLAGEYGVNHTTIRKVLAGKLWAHVA